MSDGIKAYYEDLEDRAYRESMAKLRGIPYDDLLDTLEEIKKNVSKFHSEFSRGSRYEFFLIDKIKKDVEKLV